MYSKEIIERFKNPRNAGGLRGANGVGKVGNAACGDIMKVYLLVDDNGIIKDARFKTFGCCAAIASTDVACDLIKGKTLDEALKVTNKQVYDILGEMPPHKIHCSVLAEESIHAAVEDYYKRKDKANKKSAKSDDDED